MPRAEQILFLKIKVLYKVEKPFCEGQVNSFITACVYVCVPSQILSPEIKLEKELARDCDFLYIFLQLLFGPLSGETSNSQIKRMLSL